jgi:hypothetical protein
VPNWVADCAEAAAPEARTSSAAMMIERFSIVFPSGPVTAPVRR